MKMPQKLDTRVLPFLLFLHWEAPLWEGLAPSHKECWATASLPSPPSPCHGHRGWCGATLIHPTSIEKRPLTEKWKLTVSGTPPPLLCTSFHIQYYCKGRNFTTGLFTLIGKIKLQLCIPALYFGRGGSVAVLPYSEPWQCSPDWLLQIQQHSLSRWFPYCRTCCSDGEQRFHPLSLWLEHFGDDSSCPWGQMKTIHCVEVLLSHY